jgi:hypothetical protein
MDTKKTTPKKPLVLAKKPAAGKVMAKGPSTSLGKFNVDKLAGPKKAAAAGKRVVMDPVVEPKHISAAAIRHAVRRVAAG